ncbi:hypothetical protein [Candidatus Uabimicrobium amorphum]|uniref:Uncharacterized protein n=1 Tax=Uabimicrobium amorphum TaxID=2596890 RepID=A0A5S9IJ14_UABAM|nr:hypothetical protein [Candidatus Uabimicrobium amorphum]BBM82282.1 hypothetical protein UABAM_00625 [Candidatus Uabimicrobium amorphum]
MQRWNYPQFRPGIMGKIEKVVGPGMSKTELVVVFASGTVAATMMIAFSVYKDPQWSLLQTIIATLLVFDLVGGAVCNATSPTKRWYHRAQSSRQSRILFVVGHAAYPFLVAWLFRAMDWKYFCVVYGYLCFSAVIVAFTALYLQRCVAVLILCGAIFIDSYIFTLTPGFEWFIPILFLKLIVGHMVKEEPYTAEE